MHSAITQAERGSSFSVRVSFPPLTAEWKKVRVQSWSFRYPLVRLTSEVMTLCLQHRVWGAESHSASSRGKAGHRHCLLRVLCVIRSFCGVLSKLTQTLSCKASIATIQICCHENGCLLHSLQKQGDLQLLLPKVSGYKVGFAALLPFQTLSIVGISQDSRKKQKRNASGGDCLQEQAGWV